LVEQQFDRNLADRMRGLASILFQVGDEVDFAFSQELMPEYEAQEAPAYFELRFADGALLERSGSLGGRPLEMPPDVGAELRYWDAPLPDGRAGRYVARRVEIHHVHPEEGPGRPVVKEVVIAIALGREQVARAERRVLAYCLASCLALVAMIGALSWLAVERGLGPARRLAQTLDAVDVEHLPERFETGPLPSELAPVGEKSRALIARVDAALRRERRTAADIAHELRTPISELVTVAEVALQRNGDVEAARQALGTVRDVSWRMGSSVSTLLKLARLEMGAESFARVPVDVGEVIDEVLRPLRGLARERGLAVENRVNGESRVECDPEVLRIVVSNLMSNALHHADRGSAIECRFARDGAGWSLVVDNAAVELRAEDLEALAQPFWRKDRARADRGHAGLGLALSHALAERTGLRLAFALEAGRFRAVLRG